MPRLPREVARGDPPRSWRFLDVVRLRGAAGGEDPGGGRAELRRRPAIDHGRYDAPGSSDLGYVEGQTIAFEIRFAGMKLERFPGLAADLVRRKVDVILVSGPAAIRAAREATRTIPIVALDLESDPAAAGFAQSFAQPGGNITGCFLDQ